MDPLLPEPVTERLPFLGTDLAKLPREALLDQRSLAGALHVAPRTLRRMVIRFEIPPGIKVGARKIWLAGKVIEYLERRAQDLASSSGDNERRLARLL